MNGFIDYDHQITDKWRESSGHRHTRLCLLGSIRSTTRWPSSIDSLIVDIPQPTDGRKPKRIPLNEANFAKKEFQELWGRINHKAVYQVEFDSAELIAKCVAALDRQLHGRPLQYVIQAGEQAGTLDADDLARGRASA